MAQKSNLTIEVLSILSDHRKYFNHYYFDYQSPPDQAFSGCDEYHLLYSRMYISRFWHEFKHRCPLYRTDRNQHSYNVTIQRIHPDFPFGDFILYSLIRRNNKFTLSAESSECGYCTYHGCFFICQSIGDENTQPYKWGSF